MYNVQIIWTPLGFVQKLRLCTEISLTLHRELLYRNIQTFADLHRRIITNSDFGQKFGLQTSISFIPGCQDESNAPLPTHSLLYHNRINRPIPPRSCKLLRSCAASIDCEVQWDPTANCYMNHSWRLHAHFTTTRWLEYDVQRDPSPACHECVTWACDMGV